MDPSSNTPDSKNQTEEKKPKMIVHKTVLKKKIKHQNISLSDAETNKNIAHILEIKKKLRSRPLIPKNEQEMVRKLVLDEETIQKLEKFPTFKKICILQSSLKYMQSIKERFEFNKDDVLKKLRENCQEYYKYKILSKNIFRHCGMNSKFDEVFEYNLIDDAKNYLKSNYQPLNDFLFLLRNNNKYMLKIIENCSEATYEEFSDFIVHFCYEDTSKGSFDQDELLTLVYLLIEKLILIDLPKNLEKDDYNTPINYLKNNILYQIFKNFTRKIDIRNFLCNVLGRPILRMETFRMPLSVDIKVINNYLRITNFVNDNMTESILVKSKSELTKSQYSRQKKNLVGKNRKSNPKNISFSSNSMGGCGQFLKRATKINLGGGESEIVLLSQKMTQDVESIKEKDEENENNKEDENDNKEEDNKENENNDDEENKENNDDEPDNIDEVVLDPFFEENSITIDYLKNKLKEYETKNSSNNVDIAMKEYLIFLLKDTEKKIEEIKNKKNNLYSEDDDENSTEIYSNSKIIKNLKSMRLIKQKDSFNQLVDSLLKNQKRVIKRISKIIKKFRKKLNSAPYSLQLISTIIEKLLNKKYGNTLSCFQKYMFRMQFIFGNILFPILKNPDYNGIIHTDVLSKISEENLTMFYEILNKMISGNLFDNEKTPYLTLFNKFILEKIPEIFELVDIYFNKTVPFSNRIQNLFDSSDDINSESRNINYDYFTENPTENIKYQSICFSWQIIYLMVLTLNKCTDYFITDNKDEFSKNIFQKIFDNQTTYINNFINEKRNELSNYFFLLNTSYKKSFENKLLSILRENFIEIIPKKSQDMITAFKKCISEVLAYTNMLHKESFNSFTERIDEIYVDEETIKKLDEIIKKEGGSRGNSLLRLNSENYQKIKPGAFKLNLVGLGTDESEDADFKDEIYPQIKENILYEIGHDFDDDYIKRIIFCCNFIDLYLENIPLEYRINNYNKLFLDLIKDEQTNINYLTNKFLFQFQLKIKGGEKLNLVSSNYYKQLKNMETCKCVEYLYSKVCVPKGLIINKNLQTGIIESMKYEPQENNSNINNGQNYINEPIMSFIEKFPNFHEFEDQVDDIIKLQEKIGVPDVLNEYFKSLRNIVKNEKVLKRFDKNEIDNLIIDLENYILLKLYDKIYPSKSNKEDIIFYNKCLRLDFIKPENYIQDKNIVNEKLWKTCIDYLNEIDYKLTPLDKLKSFQKAIDVLQNSISFCSGKDKLGMDDVVNPMTYIIIKSKPKNIFSNYDYCEMYLNSELSKKQYGVLLSQLGLAKNVIMNMKYTDLIGVTEEEFGKDELV